MTTNKIHTSNLELTDKVIINEMFKAFRKDSLIDIAKQNMAFDGSKAIQKIEKLGGKGLSYVMTIGEHVKWAIDENGNILHNRYLVLDWANRKEEEKSDIVGKRIKEIVESFGYEVDWDRTWFDGVCIKARKGMFWDKQTKRWEEITV